MTPCRCRSSSTLGEQPIARAAAVLGLSLLAVAVIALPDTSCCRSTVPVACAIYRCPSLLSSCWHSAHEIDATATVSSEPRQIALVLSSAVPQSAIPSPI
ncbi:hypothetical protein NL676_019489 [Syzygium grande]|nr:hypothetical protein NL676_019489 [Syzygium grande]